MISTLAGMASNNEPAVRLSRNKRAPVWTPGLHPSGHFQARRIRSPIDQADSSLSLPDGSANSRLDDACSGRSTTEVSDLHSDPGHHHELSRGPCPAQKRDEIRVRVTGMRIRKRKIIPRAQPNIRLAMPTATRSIVASRGKLLQRQIN
jgi:hypothetical protein